MNKIIGAIITVLSYIVVGIGFFFIGWILRAAKARKVTKTESK